MDLTLTTNLTHMIHRVDSRSNLTSQGSARVNLARATMEEGRSPLTHSNRSIGRSTQQHSSLTIRAPPNSSTIPIGMGDSMGVNKADSSMDPEGISNNNNSSNSNSLKTSTTSIINITISEGMDAFEFVMNSDIFNDLMIIIMPCAFLLTILIYIRVIHLSLHLYSKY